MDESAQAGPGSAQASTPSRNSADLPVLEQRVSKTFSDYNAVFTNGASSPRTGRKLYWGSPYPPSFDAPDVWALTERQQAERLEHFRLNLEQRGVLEPGSIGKPGKPTIHTLLRYLKARKYNIDLATEMFVNSQQWRASFGADDILDTFEYTVRDKFIQYYPQGYHKTDKMGRPMYIQQVGKINMKELKKFTNDDDMIKFHVQEYERLVHKIMPLCSRLQGRNIEQTFAIMDVKGVGLSQFTQEVRTLLGKITSIDQDNYPEMMGHMCIINAPMAFRAIFRLVKPMLDQRTQEKIEVCPGDYLPSLLKWVDIDNLPEFIGGRSKGSLLDDIGAWNDPEILQEIEDEFRMDAENMHVDGSKTPVTGSHQINVRGLSAVNDGDLEAFRSPRSLSECESFFSFKSREDDTESLNSFTSMENFTATQLLAGVSSPAVASTGANQSMIDRTAKLENQVAKVATRLKPFLPKNYTPQVSTAPEGSLLHRVEVMEDSMTMLLLAQEQEYVQKGRAIQKQKKGCCTIM